MKRIFLVVAFYLMSALIAEATPIVYDFNGQKTTDGQGTLIGSYIYDPETNIFYDENAGAVYTTMPNIVSFETTPQVKVNFTNYSVIFRMGSNDGITSSFADISGGSMPLYYLGTDLKFSITDPAAWTSQYAVRFVGRNVSYGDGATFGSRFDFGKDIYGNDYLPYGSPLYSTFLHVAVPEPSSLLMLLFGSIGFIFFKHREAI